MERRSTGAPFPPNETAFGYFATGLRKRVALAPAAGLKTGYFLATGGAVWQESSVGQGYYIEGSTPECHSARQALIWQRAQDRLFHHAADYVEKIDRASFRRFTLLKNDRDSVGHTYGAQENYQAIVASGWRLAAWRLGLVALLPLVMATWLAGIASIAIYLVYLLIAGILYLFVQAHVKPLTSQAVGVSLFGKQMMGVDRSDSPDTPWVEWCLYVAEAIVCTPLLVCVLLLARMTAFHRLRRHLLPFLVSRAAICGAGHLDRDDHFWLSDKAPGIRSVCGLGAFVGPHPIFTFGHFFKAMAYGFWSDRRDYLRLFRKHQRLQISIGDSNMAELAEYLRIGATLLVIDAIEANHLPDLPPLRRPLAALRTLARDSALAARVKFGRDSLSACEIQRRYWDCCRRYLAASASASSEQNDILARWGEVLDRLQRDQESLVGDVDWITKRFLFAQAGNGASWEARKKIDLRYHELTDDGYYAQFATTGFATRIVSNEEIEFATSHPPQSGPAWRRGTLVRRLRKHRKVLRVSWTSIKAGCCRNVRRIWLDDETRSRRRARRSSRGA